MFHTWSWLAWLAAAALPAFTLRNPFYLIPVLGAAWTVYATLGRASLAASSWGTFIKIGLFFLALTIPFNALSVHFGQIVLFHLPAKWPLVGGPITLEAILAGVVNGLALFTILVVFAAFNAVVDHYQLLRTAPSSLFQAGVVMSIAITFVPQMILSGNEIRQAQRIRGHRFRHVRDLLPLVMPLLASGLERAIQLAETMEARGFGGAVQPLSRREALATQWGILVALIGLLAGLLIVAYFPGRGPWGWALAASGLIALLAILWLQGNRVRRTRYRLAPWHARDTAVVFASAIVVVVVVTARLTVPGILVYSPYPPHGLLPPFSPGLGAALLLLTLPAILAPRSSKAARLSLEPTFAEVEPAILNSPRDEP